MPMISPRPSIASRLHACYFQNPGEPIPDGDGGYQIPWTDLDPPLLWMRIDPVTADVERLQAGTTHTNLSHLVSGPFHPDVTPQTRLRFSDATGRQRTLEIAGVAVVDERGISMVLTCNEQQIAETATAKVQA